MKKFFIGWFLWQVLVLGWLGLYFDESRTSSSAQILDDNIKVNCSSVEYRLGVGIIDITLPLIQFTHMGPRDCNN